MHPTLLVGDKIIVNKNLFIKHQIVRGDIVAFRSSFDFVDTPVKRVVGLPGETIFIEKGRIYINGKHFQENYAIYSGNDGNRTYGPYNIPKNNVFTLGDNRENKYDSRFIGSVPLADVTGKAWRIYWSSGKNKTRWHRILEDVN